MDFSKYDFKQTVAAIVRDDYRTAEVFRKYGVNFCCGGNIYLEDVCNKNGFLYEDLVKELENAGRTFNVSCNLQFNTWKIDFLTDYIINVHHSYLYNTLPSLQSNLTGFVNNHKLKYPGLEEIPELFVDISSILISQSRYEEEIIFPYIKQIENAHRRREPYGNLFVRTLRKPLENIQKEHGRISTRLNELRTLTNDYNFPDSACTNHRVIFQELRDFDKDLVQHKHLENNILFPKAISVEQQLLAL